MVWPLTWAVILGTLPGVFVGAIIRVKYLPDPKSFKLFAALVLLYIGWRMVRDIVKGKTRRSPGRTPGKSGFRTRTVSFNFRRIVYEFEGETCSAPTPGIMALALVVGVVGGVYGIGGGAIIAPFFVAYFGLPVYTVAGAALMGTLITSISGVAFYQAIAPFYPNMSVAPDWTLGVLFGLGGLLGTYLGARTQKFVPDRAIKAILAFSILFVAAKYVLGFFGLF